jgi:hypothetical protein
MQFEFRCTTRRALVAGPWVQVGDEWVRYNISGTHPERAAYCFQSRVNPYNQSAATYIPPIRTHSSQETIPNEQMWWARRLADVTLHRDGWELRPPWLGVYPGTLYGET